MDIMDFVFCVGLYTNIDLFINITGILNYTSYHSNVLFCLYKHIFMDIVALFKNLFCLSTLPANYQIIFFTWTRWIAGVDSR